MNLDKLIRDVAAATTTPPAVPARRRPARRESMGPQCRCSRWLWGDRYEDLARSVRGCNGRGPRRPRPDGRRSGEKAHADPDRPPGPRGPCAHPHAQGLRHANALVVRRRIRIEAPPEAIFPLIQDFRRWTAWSPYEELDPNLKRTYSGAPFGVGAIYDWTGNKVGAGRMQITEAAVRRRNS